MQFKTKTDYAIQILMYLATQRSNVRRGQLSERLGLAVSYLVKILMELRRAGWITSGPGANGGYRLAKSPKWITLLDVMKRMEDNVKIDRCLEGDHFCSRGAADYCSVHRLYQEFQDFLEWYFGSFTIADLVEGKNDPDFTKKITAIRQLIAEPQTDAPAPGGEVQRTAGINVEEKNGGRT